MKTVYENDSHYESGFFYTLLPDIINTLSNSFLCITCTYIHTRWMLVLIIAHKHCIVLFIPKILYYELATGENK